MIQRHKVCLCVYLLLEKEGQLLLSLRQNTGYADGQWGLVSGHAESQETLREALVREVQEEIGLHLDINAISVVHVLHRRSDRENVDFFMKCSSYEGEITNHEPHKCQQLAFFPKDDLPAMTIPYIKHVLKQMDDGVVYSEYGWDDAH